MGMHVALHIQLAWILHYGDQDGLIKPPSTSYMNLNYSATTEQLSELIQMAQHTSTHHLVIDFDGEVVIDPEVYFPDVALDKYKFSTRIMDATLRNEQTAQALYAALYVIYESLQEPMLPAYVTGESDMGIAA